MPDPTPLPRDPNVHVNKRFLLLSILIVVGGLIWKGGGQVLEIIHAPPAISLPKEVHGDVGRPIEIVATTNATDIRWISTNPALELIHRRLLSSTHTAVAISNTPGSYPVFAAGVRHGQLSDFVPTTVIVGKPGPGPTPPGPAPGPGPAPDPVPAPDQLVESLQIGYAADGRPANKLADLTSIMSAVVDAAKRSGKVNTTLDLQTAVRNATDLAIGKGELSNTRSKIGAYISHQLPNTDVPMTADLWIKAATAYQAVAAALKKVK